MTSESRRVRNVETLAPLVSILVPVLNEEDHIIRILTEIEEFEYPIEAVEVLVIDGGSEDSTKELLQGWIDQHGWPRLLHNPRRIQSAALNLGAASAGGEFLVRLDAHASYDRSYLARLVRAASGGHCGVVGGVQLWVGRGPVGRAAATAAHSLLGSGFAAYRRESPVSRPVDSVFLGCWRASTFRSAGGFDETLHVNEDYEFCVRLRKLGYQVCLVPGVRTIYHPRERWRALWIQFFRYGYWKTRTLRIHPSSVRLRQLGAPLLVGTILGGLALALVNPVSVIPLLAYLGVLAGFALIGLRRHGGKAAVLSAVALGVMHCAWGAGFLAGVIRGPGDGPVRRWRVDTGEGALEQGDIHSR